MEPPDLADLIGLWLEDNAPTFYVERRDPEYDSRPILGWVSYSGFGQVVTIYEDHIVINIDSRDPKGLKLMAADPKMFELLSNRLYIMEQGFIKAAHSRIETAKRDKEKGNPTIW